MPLHIVRQQMWSQDLKPSFAVGLSTVNRNYSLSLAYECIHFGLIPYPSLSPFIFQCRLGYQPGLCNKNERGRERVETAFVKVLNYHLQSPVHKCVYNLCTVYGCFFYMHALSNSHIISNTYTTECVFETPHLPIYWFLISFIKWMHIGSFSQTGVCRLYLHLLQFVIRNSDEVWIIS